MPRAGTAPPPREPGYGMSIYDAYGDDEVMGAGQPAPRQNYGPPQGRTPPPRSNTAGPRPGDNSGYGAAWSGNQRQMF